MTAARWCYHQRESSNHMEQASTLVSGTENRKRGRLLHLGNVNVTHSSDDPDYE